MNLYPDHSAGLHRCVWLTLVAALLLLNGCGFALRTAPELPPAMERTYVTVPGAGRSDLWLDLADALRQSGVSVLEAAADDAAELRVTTDRVQRRVVSVDQDGRALEFELLMTVVFSVHRGDKELLPRQTLRLSREFAFDRRVLGGEAEGERLIGDMRRDAVRQIMLRLQRVPDDEAPA